jgi:hypothetical protein
MVMCVLRILWADKWRGGSLYEKNYRWIVMITSAISFPDFRLSATDRSGNVSIGVSKRMHQIDLGKMRNWHGQKCATGMRHSLRIFCVPPTKMGNTLTHQH